MFEGLRGVFGEYNSFVGVAGRGSPGLFEGVDGTTATGTDGAAVTGVDGVSLTGVDNAVLTRVEDVVLTGVVDGISSLFLTTGEYLPLRLFCLVALELTKRIKIEVISK